MSPLLVRKILRSMWENRRSYLACVMVITIGVMMNIVMSNLADAMRNAVNTYYDDYRMADIFAQVKTMPASNVEALENIPGIAIADGRLVKDVRVNMPDSDRAIILRLIGVDPGENDRLNDFIYDGEPILNTEDILIGPEFFAAYGYSIGDAIEVIVDGSIANYTIRGTAQSPEYVYMIPNTGTIYPDPASFNIGIVHSSGLETVAGSIGFVNDLAFMLEEGFRFTDIKDELRAALEPYGVVRIVEKKDQLSFSMTDLEITGITAYATIFPMFFFIIAVIVLYIMLRRVVEQERVTIGTLKAFGYADIRILYHYILYGSVTGLIGGVLGSVLGIPMFGVYFELMMSFFNIPGMRGQVAPFYVISGLFMAVLTASLAAFFGVRGILQLRPADSMRPAAPPVIKESWLDRSRIIKSILTSRGMMSLRYMIRNKLRSAFILISITMSCALMTVIFSMNLMIDQMILAQVERAQTYDYQALLKTPTEYNSAVNATMAVEGVTAVEAIFELPVTLTKSNISKGAIITGLPADSQLYFVIDQDYKRYPPSEFGLTLGQNVADELGVKAGDLLELSTSLLSEPVSIPIVRTIIQPFGTGCFMEINALARLMGTAPLATSVIFNADPTYAAEIKSDLLEAQNVSTLEDKKSMVRTFSDFLDSFVYIFFFLALMAVIIGFSVIYNISKVSLSERSRELATMRVLGLTVEETNEIITFEHWLLCLVAILLGLPLAVAMRYALAGAFPSDSFTIPTTTPNEAFILSALGCMTSVWLANRSAGKSIAQIDLVEVLKERE